VPPVASNLTQLTRLGRKDTAFLPPRAGMPSTSTDEPSLNVSTPEPTRESPSARSLSTTLCTRFCSGQLSLIHRGERYALRVKHADAPSRLQFTGVDSWPADPGWKLEGRLLPHPPGKTLPIVDIIGTAIDASNPGVVEFIRDGKTYRIEAMGEPGQPLFLVFADRTSGHGSYPAGRFMDVPGADAQGRVVLDFNRAYNPPCAFTPFATCPLPPPENRLDLAVTAGEKAYVPAKSH
jgi:uncharacterized protein (DUF1684 family)